MKFFQHQIENNDYDCCFCYHDFTEKDTSHECVSLPCGHKYGKSCITKYFVKQGILSFCPHCYRPYEDVCEDNLDKYIKSHPLPKDEHLKMSETEYQVEEVTLEVNLIKVAEKDTAFNDVSKDKKDE
uniref:RING-type domain-containing protein n=1 Tax=Parastrongyloides trichosuri TaxID=131310 RepID=A0A0N4ZCF5_PARTI